MALGIPIFVFADSVVGAGISSYSNNITTNSALNYVEVTSVGPGSSRDITEDSLSEFEWIDHVVDSSGWAQIDLAIEAPANWPTANNPGAFLGTPFISGITPKILLGDIPDEGVKGKEIILPDMGQGQDYIKLLGKEISFVYTKEIGPGNGEPVPISLRVAGIYDNSPQARMVRRRLTYPARFSRRRSPMPDRQRKEQRTPGPSSASSPQTKW